MNNIINRPSEFMLKAHTGMLESLGHNMYTSVAKSLVEFVANGYDAEAEYVKLIIPFDEIDKASSEYTETLKVNKKEGKSVLELSQSTISKDVSIIIEDNGHGMSHEDIASKFMPINRNRRKKEKNGNKSLTGKRFVMGRKGLGKLAGFGIAELITIKTKKEGNNYETTFKMDFNEIQKHENITDVKIPATYKDNLDINSKYTIITLSHLRSDTLKSKKEQIIKELCRNFHIVKDEFTISLNNEKVEEDGIIYDYTYPEELNDEGYFEEKLNIDELGNINIKYVVKFRDTEQNNDEKLLADYRGARIYCNGRLALGPSLLKLKPGAHTFHAQNNMECIVHADDLDRHEDLDFINTNRSSLKADNEIVSKLIDKISEVMKNAIEDYNEFRNNKIEKEIEKDSYSEAIIATASHLGEKSRQAVKKLLKITAVSHGLNSSAYKEMAPLLIQSVNAGEVLTRLITLSDNPISITNVMHELNELKEIEDNDVIKLYRGRRNGIIALENLILKGDEQWKKKQFEEELHRLLKQAPWLIKPEYSRFLSSNETLDTIIKRINKEFKIDTEADINEKNYDDTRPDLVFSLSGNNNNNFVVVELKSPALPLNNNHLIQLEKYILKIRNFVRSELRNENITVKGYLIGSMPDNTTINDDEGLLIHKINDVKDCEIMSLPQLLERAKVIHIDTISALEKREENELHS